MMIGEATTHSTQFEGCTGALSAPVKASVAHLKVKGTASVASLAANSSTTDQTTRIFRSVRSPGQIYGHRWASVPVRLACPSTLSEAAAGSAGVGSGCAMEPGPAQFGTPNRRAHFRILSHSGSHIERLVG